MSEIRKYTYADLGRAKQMFSDTRGRDFFPYGRTDAFLRRSSQENRSEVLETAKEMHIEHKDWVDAKFRPLVTTYLQAPETRHTTDEAIYKHYQTGLQDAVVGLSVQNKGQLDLQDVVAGYTANFISMLRTCQSVGINPDSAVQLAARTYKTDRHEVTSLIRENSDLPSRAVERALLSSERNPRKFLEHYRRLAGDADRLARYDRFSNLPYHVLVSAAKKGLYAEDLDRHLRRFEDVSRDLLTENANPYSFDGILNIDQALYPEELISRLRMFEDTSRDLQTEETADASIYNIDGIPRIRQRHGNWCGYSSLSMVLQYNGFADLTPEQLFRQDHGYYDPVAEFLDPSEGPSIDTLAILAKKATSLNVRIIERSDHDDLKAKNPERYETPLHTLKFFLEGKIPVIVRFPKHFSVVKGYDPIEDTYSILDPLSHSDITLKSDRFEHWWSRREPDNYQRDGSYLMMVVAPPRRTR